MQPFPEGKIGFMTSLKMRFSKKNKFVFFEQKSYGNSSTVGLLRASNLPTAVWHLWRGVRLRWLQDWLVSRERVDKLGPVPAVQGPGSSPLHPPHREPLGVPRPRGRLSVLAVNGWCSPHLESWGGLDLRRAQKVRPCAKWVQLPSRWSKSLQSCWSQGPFSWLTAFTSRLLSNTRSAKSFSSQLFQSKSGSVCLVGAFHWRSRAVSPSETAPQLHRSGQGSQSGTADTHVTS